MNIESNEIIAELNGDKIKKEQIRLVLTNDRLFMEWDEGINKGREGWHYSLLEPYLGFSQARPQKAKYRLVGGITLIVLSVVFFFSTVQNNLPLFSPVLLIFGLFLLVLGTKDYRVEKWTIFRKKDGSRAAWIRHSQCNELDRLTFEDKYQSNLTLYKMKHEPD